MQRQVTGTILHKLGLKSITFANDGTEAWEILKHEKFDLLITDWIMPKMTGIELLNNIRSSVRLDDLPVLVCTSKDNKNAFVEAMKAKANDYVIKPSNLKFLLRKFLIF